MTDTLQMYCSLSLLRNITLCFDQYFNAHYNKSAIDEMSPLAEPRSLAYGVIGVSLYSQ